MTTPEPVTDTTETSRLEAATRALVRQRSQGICDENYPNACSSCDCFHAETKAATGHGFAMERQHAIAVLEAADVADAAAGIRRAEEAVTTVESPTDRVLQVIRANFGDRLIIRIPADLDMDAIEDLQKALTELNAGVKLVFLTSGLPVEPEPEFLERACEVLHDAYEHAATGAGWVTNPASRKPWAEVPAENQATMRAAVTALWQWMTGG